MTTSEKNIQIANTILSQFGGGQFALTVGVKNPMAIDNGVQFGIGRGAKAGINKILVTLNGCDLYDVEFWKCGKFDFECVKSLSDVYAEDLRRIFTDATGFHCTVN